MIAGAGEKAAAPARSRLSPKVKKLILIGIATMIGLEIVIVGGLVAIMLWAFPNVCDDMLSDGVQNAQGDTAYEREVACTSLGSYYEYSIVLKLRNWPELVRVANYDERIYVNPRLRWSDDKTLVLRFSAAEPVWSRLSRLGDIRIVYDFSSKGDYVSPNSAGGR